MKNPLRYLTSYPTAPLSATWTPREGERIERFHTPLIIAFERRQHTARQDYSAAQWARHRAWVHTVDAGVSLRRLTFVRWCVDHGRYSEWPDQSVAEAGR